MNKFNSSSSLKTSSVTTKHFIRQHVKNPTIISSLKCFLLPPTNISDNNETAPQSQQSMRIDAIPTPLAKKTNSTHKKSEYKEFRQVQSSLYESSTKFPPNSSRKVMQDKSQNPEEESKESDSYLRQPRRRVIRITGSLNCQFFTQPSKSVEQPEVFVKKQCRHQVTLTQQEEDLNLREIIKKDLEQLERSEKMSNQITNQTTEKLIPLTSTIAPQPDLYLKCYKQRERMKGFQELYDVKPNIYVKMNEKVCKIRVKYFKRKIFQTNTLPRKLGLISGKQVSHLKANNLFGSQKYIDIFAEGLSSQTYKNLKSISLQSNNLNSQKIEEVHFFQINVRKLSRKLPLFLQSIDLSKNNINKSAILHINSNIIAKQQNLQLLNLENNQLNDEGAILVLEAMTEHKQLSIINLSMNYISDRSMETLEKLLRKSASLLELYLHYNSISSNGGLQLFRGVQRNQYLRVLDVSFNQLGGKNRETISLIARLSNNQLSFSILGKPHPELTHLDLSYNRFTAGEAKIFSENLIFNQQLFGLHFYGNVQGWILNQRGYLIDASTLKPVKKQIQIHPDRFDTLEDEGGEIEAQNKINQLHEEEDQNKNLQFFTRIQGVSPVAAHKEGNIGNADICWICEDWQEIKFQWFPQKSGSLSTMPIFIHLEFEDYRYSYNILNSRPILMKEEKDYFYLYRMCPPHSQVKYFFSNPVENEQLYAKDQKIVRETSKLKYQGVPLKYADGTYMESQPMSIVNCIQTKSSTQVIGKHYLPNVCSRPREPEKIVDIDPQIAKKRHWSIENSIFKDFAPDTDGHLEQCFELDFECGKLLRNFSEEIGPIMKSVYKHILSCYKYYASIALHYEFPLVNLFSLKQFISRTSIMQKKLMSSVDLDLSFLSSYVLPRESNFLYVRDKCLVRFQFVEIIIRLAKEQYIRTNKCKNMAEAVERLFQHDEVLDWVKQFGVGQEWRDTRYWTEIMDMTISN